MKNYKSMIHIAIDHRSNIDNNFQKSVAKAIEENQNNGYQSEVQYSTCASNGSVVYSALVLAYTEE